MSYYQKNCFQCQLFSVLIFQQSLTQEAANIIGELENEEANQQLTQEAADIINALENELTDDDAHLTQEAIDIINELENYNANTDNSALLESPADCQQLTRDSLQCLQDNEGWIVDEVSCLSIQMFVCLSARIKF